MFGELNLCMNRCEVLALTNTCTISIDTLLLGLFLNLKNDNLK